MASAAVQRTTMSALPFVVERVYECVCGYFVVVHGMKPGRAPLCPNCGEHTHRTHLFDAHVMVALPSERATQQADAHRERAARRSPCCAPEMCRICWEEGGHRPPPPRCAFCGSAGERDGGPPVHQIGYMEPLHDSCQANLARWGSH